MTAPSEDALRSKLTELMKDADLETTSARSIRKQLEEFFGVPLDDRKQFITTELQKILDADQDEAEPEPPKKSAPKRKKEPAPPEAVEAPKRQRPAPRAAPISERQMQGLGRAAAPKARRGPERDTNKDPNAPKKPSSAYNFFTKTKGAELKEQLPNSTLGQRMKQVGRAWQVVSDKEKREYEDMAEADKERYQKEMDAYVPPSEEQLRAAKDAAKERRKKNSVFIRPVKLSPELAAILGGDTMPRSEIMKRINAYVNEHNLKDPKDGRWAICDGPLQAITGEERVKVFGIQKHFKDHITAISPADGEAGAEGDDGEEEDGDEEGEDAEGEGAAAGKGSD